MFPLYLNKFFFYGNPLAPLFSNYFSSSEELLNLNKIINLQGWKNSGFNIAILSGRSKATKEATKEWLKKYNVPYHILKMRPTRDKWKYMSDNKLKQHWLDELWPLNERKDKLFMVFDDRKKVVDMWRKNNLTCCQVAEGNF